MTVLVSSIYSAKKIQISEPTNTILDLVGGFNTELRGSVSVKVKGDISKVMTHNLTLLAFQGKGEVNTYWLRGQNLGSKKKKVSMELDVDDVEVHQT